MKKASTFLTLFVSLFLFSVVGCGGHKAQVVEAPAEETDPAAMEGMDDDEYNQAMSDSLNNKGE